MGMSLTTGLAKAGTEIARAETRIKLRNNELLLMRVISFQRSESAERSSEDGRVDTQAEEQVASRWRHLFFLVHDPEKLRVNGPAAATAGCFYLISFRPEQPELRPQTYRRTPRGECFVARRIFLLHF